mgnify:CR=1 FL=1
MVSTRAAFSVQTRGRNLPVASANPATSIIDESKALEVPRKRIDGVELTFTEAAIRAPRIVEFTRKDVVRHPLVQRIITAYEEHRGQAKSTDTE